MAAAAKTDKGWPTIKGKPAAKIQTHLEEKVGLPGYSNVTYGSSVTRFVEDSPAAIDAAILENEERVETWMKDYCRREVEPLYKKAAESLADRK